MTTIGELDRIVRARHLLKHPFYVAWSQGTVPMPTLRRYAEQYYHFEVNFPRYVAGAYARLPSPSDRQLLLENLTDEEGRSPTHPELWAKFARALGTSVDVRRHPPIAATNALLAVYERALDRGAVAEQLGTLYAYESQFPDVAQEKSRGLRVHYGLTSPIAHEFFRVHVAADVEHSRAERRLLARTIRRDARAGRAAERGVRGAVGAWWAFLDAFSTGERPAA